MSRMVNLVRVLTSSTGTATMTLGAAYSQLFMTSAEANMVDGRTYTYLIVDGNNWELGKGVYTATGTTLSRVTVLASRISGTLGTTKITLSGTAQVRIIESADDMGALRGTRAVTGTSDTIADNDLGGAITYSNAGAVAVSLAQAGASAQFLDGWTVWMKNTGAGAVTITPATSTINGGSSLVLAQNMGAFIWSDGTNYHAYFFPVTKPLLAANNLSDLVNAATARANIGVSDVGPNRNRLVNPTGQVWQLQNSGAAAITDGTYAFDQWLGLTQTAGITASQVTNAENGTPYMMRLSQANAAAQRMGLIQWLERENCIDLRGQQITLSARVRMSASTTLRYAIVEWTGTADTITKDIVLDWTSGTFTAGNFFTSISTAVTATGSLALTANTPANISLTGIIGSSANNVAVFFWTDSTQAQNVTFDIGKVQLEVGTFATAFAPRPFGMEVSLCQRFYEKSFPQATAPAQNAGLTGSYTFGQVAGASVNQAGTPVTFKVTKRTTPIVTFFNPQAANSQIRGTTVALDWTGTAASNVGDTGFGFSGTSPAGSSPGIFNAFHWTADARL